MRNVRIDYQRIDKAISLDDGLLERLVATSEVIVSSGGSCGSFDGCGNCPLSSSFSGVCYDFLNNDTSGRVVVLKEFLKEYDDKSKVDIIDTNVESKHDIAPFKMIITPENAIIVQWVLFRNGCKWNDGDTEIYNIGQAGEGNRNHNHYIWLNSDKLLTFDADNYMSTVNDEFAKIDIPELSFDEFIKLYFYSKDCQDYFKLCAEEENSTKEESTPIQDYTKEINLKTNNITWTYSSTF